MNFQTTPEFLSRLEAASECGSQDATTILEYLKRDIAVPEWLAGRWKTRKRTRHGEVISVTIIQEVDGRTFTLDSEAFRRRFVTHGVITNRDNDMLYVDQVKFSRLFDEGKRLHTTEGSDYDFIKSVCRRIPWEDAGYSDEKAEEFRGEPYITMFAEYFTKLAPCTFIAFESDKQVEGVGIVWDDVTLKTYDRSVTAAHLEAHGSVLEVPVCTGYCVNYFADTYAVQHGIQSRACGSAYITSLVNNYTAPMGPNRGYSRDIDRIGDNHSLYAMKPLKMDLSYMGGMPFEFILPANVILRNGEIWISSKDVEECHILRSGYPQSAVIYKQICPKCGELFSAMDKVCPRCRDNSATIQTIFGPVCNSKVKKIKRFGYVPEVFVDKNGKLTKAAEQALMIQLLLKSRIPYYS